jgi:hypothetical protein
MRWLLKLVTTLLLLLVLLVAGTFVWNGVPIFANPGPFSRVYRYLTSNVAETKPDHPLPELVLRCYPGEPDSLYRTLSAAIRDLDWQVVSTRPGVFGVDAVVTTPLLRFKDDVSTELRPAECGVQLWVRSASRIGRGDFGANVRHVMQLVNAFESRAGVQPD